MIQRKRLYLRKAYSAVIAAFILSWTWAVYAQVASTGAISGIVTDSTQAAVAGARVTVINQATGVSRSVSTDTKGFYSAESIDSGTYTVTINATGFKESLIKDLHIDPGQRRANNIELQLGAASSQVTVTADAVQINTETSESSGTVSAKQISNLMLNGRNFQTLAIMIPGVNSISASDEIAGGGTLAKPTLVVNGQSTEYNGYFVDGVELGSIGSINTYPIVDGIAEMRVLKDNYSAKYGGSSGAEFLVETKSGTKTFHGSAWDYLRNSAFDANNYFSTAPQSLHQNIFGYTLGGPVILPWVYNTDRKKKTFFFASNEWYVIHAPTVIRSAVFTQAMRNGDFSASPTLTGSLAIDAHSAALLAAEGKTNCVAGPKKLNPACFDPVAVALMNQFWPLPNNPAGGFQNYINQGPSNTDQTNYQYRVDHSITPNNTLIARMMYMSVDQSIPNVNFSGQGNPTGSITENTISTGFNGLVRLTSSFTPNFLNSVSVADNTTKVHYIANGGTLPKGVQIQQAFPGADPLNRIPNISVARGWATNGVGPIPITANGNQGTISDDVSWVKGNHVFQFGAVYLFGMKRQNAFTSPQGTFSFSGNHTGDPAADYMLGLDSTYLQASSERLGIFHNRTGEAYVQDDWRATPRLSLNLGLRYFYFSNSTVSGDQVTNFNPDLYTPGQAPVVNVNGSLVVNSSNVPLNSAGQPANLLNGIVFAGKNGVPSGFYIPIKTNFAPRVGFAYALTEDGKTSIRGGYGIGYSVSPIARIYNAFGTNPPFNLSANILNSTLSNGTAGTTAAPTPQTLQLAENKWYPAQSQSFSLTLERQITSHATADVAYVGSLGRHLEAYYDQNQPLPVTQPSTTGCLAAGQTSSGSYNFDPCINTSKASPNYSRPYKGYAAITYPFEHGSSNYNSFQAGFIYKAGLSQVNVAYTHSKTLGTTEASGFGQGQSIGGDGVQNSRNPAAEYGPPDFDFANSLVGAWVYDIPYFRSSSKPVALTLGNWNFAGLADFQSGFALTPGLATGKNGLAVRSNQVAPLHYVGKVNEWFSTNSFAAPAYGFFGNASNGSIRSPRYISFNVALYKVFPITQRVNFQFRAEAFNVANHSNFATVSTAFGAANYGQITSAHSPRELEFALKLTF